MAEPMNPADVPDELIRAASSAYWRRQNTSELPARPLLCEILAAVLPLHRAQILAELGDVTEAMTDRAWETLGWERTPYMARIADFTREQIDNGELQAADRKAAAMNDDLMRRAIAAALAVTPWRTVDPHAGAGRG